MRTSKPFCSIRRGPQKKKSLIKRRKDLEFLIHARRVVTSLSLNACTVLELIRRMEDYLLALPQPLEDLHF